MDVCLPLLCNVLLAPLVGPLGCLAVWASFESGKPSYLKLEPADSRDPYSKARTLLLLEAFQCVCAHSAKQLLWPVSLELDVTGRLSARCEVSADGSLASALQAAVQLTLACKPDL